MPEPAPATPIGQLVEPCGRWGGRAKFNVKIGSVPRLALIKRARRFHPGQVIEYSDTNDLEGMSTGCTPKWRTGRVASINELGMIFIDRI